VHPNYKAKVVSARDRSTTVTGQTWGHPVRTIKNQMSRAMAEMEKESQMSAEQMIAFGTGKLRLAAKDGDMSQGSIMGGQVCGMIDDVVPCKVLIGRIVATAQERIGVLGQVCT
jgi:enoyl-[acyl-carrier protein] reductase II